MASILLSIKDSDEYLDTKSVLEELRTLFPSMTVFEGDACQKEIRNAKAVLKEGKAKDVILSSLHQKAARCGPATALLIGPVRGVLRPIDIYFAAEEVPTDGTWEKLIELCHKLDVGDVSVDEERTRFTHPFPTRDLGRSS